MMRRILLRLTGCSTALALLATSCTPSIPDYCCLREEHADYDLCMIDQNVPAPCRVMSLCEIIDVALERNLDLRLQQLEDCIQSKTYVAEKLRQLPHLTVNAELANRSNEPAWYSRAPGQPIIPPPTISTEPRTSTIDITAAINLIDFGLSYYKSRQEKNRYCILRQQHLRTKQNLILDVYRSYYRAVVARTAKDRAQQLIQILENRQQELQSQVERQIVSELKGLLNENRLVDMKIRLAAFENEYRSAMTELAALMGMRPGVDFEITPIQLQAVAYQRIDPCLLDEIALRYRPELIAQDMQFEVDADEVRRQMIMMFPHVRLFAAWFNDDDYYQLHKSWTNAGETIMWDLLSIPSQYQSTKAASFQKCLGWNKRLPMSMGILTQVHLAYINIDEAVSQYGLALELQRVKDRQLEVSKLLESRDQLDADDVIAFEVEALFAEVNALKNFADIHVALEQLSNAIGRPFYFSDQDCRAALPMVEECCYPCDPFAIAPIVTFSSTSMKPHKEEAIEYLDIEKFKEMEQAPQTEPEKLEQQEEIDKLQLEEQEEVVEPPLSAAPAVPSISLRDLLGRPDEERAPIKPELPPMQELISIEERILEKLKSKQGSNPVAYKQSREWIQNRLEKITSKEE